MLHLAFISVHGSPLAPLGSNDSGGMNVYIRELSRELGRQDVSVDVFTRWQNAHQPQVVELGEKARLIHLRAGPLTTLDKNLVYQHLPEFLWRLRHFQEQEKRHYQIVHTHYWLSGWVSLRLRRHWGVPWVAMLHTLGLVKNQVLLPKKETDLRIETERRILAQADRIIATSEQEKQQLKLHYGAPTQRVEVIPCGVDLEIFRPRPKEKAKVQFGVEGRKLVLFVGRIEPLKGLDTLLRAVASLEEKGNLTLFIVGGDQESHQQVRQLEALAQELGIRENLRFLGAVAHEELPAYYNAADVCVVPSYAESFGMVALEALACGTPVIASRVGGLQSTVQDGQNGYLVPWHCPEPFAERLELLLRNDTLRHHFGLAARRSAERYGWSQVAAQVLALYHDLLEGTGTVPAFPERAAR